MKHIYTKVALLITIFTLSISFYAADSDDTNDGDCPKELSAFFSDDNINSAARDYELMAAYEQNATDLHYEREYAETAIINAKANDKKIDPDDILLIKNCPNLDKNDPTTMQLDRCMEKLHDAMEDELAARFKILKYWEKKCKEYQESKCTDKVNQYSKGLNVDLEIAENDACKICEYVSKPLDSCKR